MARCSVVLAALTLALNCSVASAQVKRIALVQAHQESRFRIELNTGAQEEAKKRNVKLTIYNANNNAAYQNDAMEAYVNDKVNAIIVLAIDANAIKPSIEDAVKAGIPVLAADMVVNGANLANIGVNNKDAARDLGRRAGEYLKAKGGSQEVGVIGALNSYVQNLRNDGFKEGLAQTNPSAKIVGMVDGQNVQNIAQNAAEGLLAGHTNLAVVYATGEPALVGAMATLKGRGANANIKLFGWDLNAQAIAGIDQGWIGTIVQQEARKLGATAVATAVDLLDGKKIPPVVSVPVSFVDKSNVDAYRGQFK